jgi:hypothetical protein
MNFTIKRKPANAFIATSLIFIVCIIITLTSTFQKSSVWLSNAVILDLTVTAPLIYYAFIRNTRLYTLTVWRVFIAGVFLSTILVSNKNNSLLHFIKTYISPCAELAILIFVVNRFYIANRIAKAKGENAVDFLTLCRSVLKSVVKSEKLSNIFAAEIAVFHYAIFSRPAANKDEEKAFTVYKENGTMLLLATFLCLFFIETIGMHFIFTLWSRSAAWVLTGLSLYTCLQLFGHIGALKARPVSIVGGKLFLRNGLLGGDAEIDIENILSIEPTKKIITGEQVIKLGLLKGLETHNLAIHLSEPVEVLKAFGIKKKATTILMHVDDANEFISAIDSLKMH